MDLVRRDLLSEEAVRSIIDSINEAIGLEMSAAGRQQGETTPE
jgi:hypothetical protein